MKLAGFFFQYFRRYLGWAALAAFTALLYGASAAVVIALSEPLFDEVLLAGDYAPAMLGLSEESDATELADGSAEPESLQDAGQRLKAFFAKLKLKDLLDRGYRRLRSSLGITDQSVVYFVPLLIVGIFLFRCLTGFVSGYGFQRIGLGVTNDIRNDLYRQILDQSSRFHEEHPSGELVSRIVNDVGMMQLAVSYRVMDLFQQSLTLLFLLSLLLSTHFHLAVACVVLTPAVLYPIVRFGRGMRRTSFKSQERMADLASLVAEGVRGHRVVKAFGMERFEYERFYQATRRHLRVNLWAQMLSSASSPVIESVAVVGLAALLIYAGLQIRADKLSAPLFISFLFNLIWMYEPIRKLNRVNLVLQQSLAAAVRVFEIMQLRNDIQEAPGARPLKTAEREITFESVEFAYDDRKVLRGVELQIRKGEVVALVGSSGAGKSTLVSLLPRFFDPDVGRVAIDGQDIRQVTLESLRSMIGIVTQEIILFDDTIRNNIGYGRRDLPLERIREAAAAAYADEFIMDKPQGYETVIGEGGLRLSGGQRQRLAIARALLKNAPILILDEATSHLDTESEALVQKALYNLMQGRTTLVIAHRLSTVMRADRIVVMEAGRIVEQGAHSELLALGGVYKRLYDLQFQG